MFKVFQSIRIGKKGVGYIVPLRNCSWVEREREMVGGRGMLLIVE